MQHEGGYVFQYADVNAIQKWWGNQVSRVAARGGGLDEWRVVRLRVQRPPFVAGISDQL